MEIGQSCHFRRARLELAIVVPAALYLRFRVYRGGGPDASLKSHNVTAPHQF